MKKKKKEEERKKENDLQERELFAIEIVREEREKSIGSIEWKARIPINKDMDN